MENTLIFLFMIVFIVLVGILNKNFSNFNERRSNSIQDISITDDMDGPTFELWCADLLRYNGFTKIQLTPSTGDQGVDIVAVKDNQKYAIQCKRYSKKLGNKPVQEVNTGKVIYNCLFAIVMTNNYFTQGAIDAANAVGVLLWDRQKLIKMLRKKNGAIYKAKIENWIPQKKKTGIVNQNQFDFSEDYSLGQSNGPNITRRMESAYSDAVFYLSVNSYSRNGLILELEDDGYSPEEARYAANRCGDIWTDQAVKTVKDYVSDEAVSVTDLIEELKGEQFTESEIQAALFQCGLRIQENNLTATDEYYDGCEIDREEYQYNLAGESYLSAETLEKIPDCAANHNTSKYEASEREIVQDHRFTLSQGYNHIESVEHNDTKLKGRKIASVLLIIIGIVFFLIIYNLERADPTTTPIKEESNNNTQYETIPDNEENQSLVISYKAITDVNLRQSVGTKSKVLSIVRKGTIVTYIDEFTTKEGYVWYKVDYNGIQGWIYAPNLEAQ